VTHAERDEYAVVGRAHRAALERAAALDPRLKGREWATLAAVLGLTAAYSRLSDRVYADDVARLAGLNERTVRQALKTLSERGVIVWRPRRGVSARGQGTRSLLSIETGDLDARIKTGPQSPGQTGPQSPGLTGHLDARNPSSLFEKENEDARAFAAAAAARISAAIANGTLAELVDATREGSPDDPVTRR
jgi:phage replication O-like protein O